MPEGKKKTDNNSKRPYTVLERVEVDVDGGEEFTLWREHPPVMASDKRSAIKIVLGEEKEATCEAVANFKPVRREIKKKVTTAWSEA